MLACGAERLCSGWITSTLVCYIATLAVGHCQLLPSTRIDRPLGVPLAKKALYEPRKGMFTCLDGSATMDISYVNDDYCDCADGSDEPGTSACRNGQFYCENKGYVPREIPSSRINDGICDCCDGSDEFDSSSHCSNTCFELGQLLRQEAERQYEVMKTGYEVRQQYIEEAKQMKGKTSLELQEAEKHLHELENRKNELEEAKKRAEELETQAREFHTKSWQQQRDEHKAEVDKQRARSIFEFLDSNGDGRVTRADLLPHINTNQNELNAEQAAFIGSMPQAYQADEWVHTAWPQMKTVLKADFMDRVLNPYGRRAPAQEQEEHTVTGEATAPPPVPAPPELDRLPDDVEGAEEEDVPEFPPEDNFDGKVDGSEDYSGEEEEEDAEDKAEHADDEHHHHRRRRYPPAPSVSSNNNDAGTNADDEDREPPYDEQTQALVDEANKARDAFRNVENDFHSQETRVKSFQNSLKNDYGPQDVFWPLHDKCFDYSDREYTYTLCPFEKVTQAGRGGGAHVTLGTWGKWVDNYSKMVFENGQKCWNGPDRSTIATLQCGIENKLLSASEPNRCVYAVTFETPAACPQPPADKDKIIEEALHGAANDDDMLRHLEL